MCIDPHLNVFEKVGTITKHVHNGYQAHQGVSERGKVVTKHIEEYQNVVDIMTRMLREGESLQAMSKRRDCATYQSSF